MKKDHGVGSPDLATLELGAAFAFIVVMFFLGPSSLYPAWAADANESRALTANDAWKLYNTKKYIESADAFESVLKSNAPSARLYYYAALANHSANRRARSRQLCEYVISHFPKSTEAAYCSRLFPEISSSKSSKPFDSKNSTAAAKSEKHGGLPDSVWNSLSPEARTALESPEGKQALAQSVREHSRKIQVIRKAEKAGLLDKSGKTIASAAASGTTSSSKSKSSMHEAFSTKSKGRRGDRPFTSQHIAADGAGGIDQNINPNCWFEASMAALAELPRGQRLIADMIRYGEPGSYIVRFPGDGVEYTITREELDTRGIRDKALWASLIECAQVMKFPDNEGADGEDGSDSRLAVGLGCITGCKAEIILPRSSGLQELSSFIFGAVSSKNPIIAGTWDDYRLAGLPDLVVSTHAYTIIGYDMGSQMVTIRNPHGKRSQRFSLKTDPNHREFQQLNDGVFKMHISLVQKYFSTICRSFI